jgi:hypothetical protein
VDVVPEMELHCYNSWIIASGGLFALCWLQANVRNHIANNSTLVMMFHWSVMLYKYCVVRFRFCAVIQPCEIMRSRNYLGKIAKGAGGRRQRKIR